MSTTFICRSTQGVPGHRFGFRTPCLIAFIRVEGSQVIDLPRIQKLFDQEVRDIVTYHRTGWNSPQGEKEPIIYKLLSNVANVISSLHDGLGCPTIEDAKVRQIKSSSKHIQSKTTEWMLLIPGHFVRSADLVLRETVSLLNGLLLSELHDDLALGKEYFDRSRKHIQKHALKGVNAHRLMRAALSKNIPLMFLPGPVFQFGWGCNSRLFKSSLSDQTPAIATGWAKDKSQASMLLKQAGLPVPEQVVVQSLGTAVREANRIGYPVVLKPASLDQGVGVESGLANETSLKLAYQRVSKLKKKLLLEKHIEGQDIRVNVIHGRFEGAVLRVPAGVTGDGKLTVSELIEAANRNPRRSNQKFSDMSILTLNDEARELLQEQGVTETTVPEAGKFIHLRRAANVSSGGVAHDITDDLHSDNRYLCERAAKVMRLDIAGVDLLIPDYRQSWREVGGAICEVNAQPGMRLTPGVYDRLLEIFLNGQGRIPTNLILTNDVACARQIEIDLADHEDTGGLRIFNELSGRVGTGVKGSVSSVREALIDTECTGLAVISCGNTIPKNGLPIDQFDRLLIASWIGNDPSVNTAIGHVLPHIHSRKLDYISEEQYNQPPEKLPSDFSMHLLDCDTALSEIVDTSKKCNAVADINMV